MTDGPAGLAASERRALLRGPLYRIVGTPLVAVFGLANTALVIRETGAEVYGLVSLVSTLTLLLPFLDFGVGATVTNASARLSRSEPRLSHSANVIRRGYRVLFQVAAGLVLLALCVMATDGWSYLVGFSSGPADRWAITVAACVLALTIPGNLAIRLLIGIDHNPAATVVTMSGPAFGFAITVVLSQFDVSGIWYALSSLGGLLISLCLGTVVALRLSGLGSSAFASLEPDVAKRGLLAGSGWLFIAAVGVPVGLQTGRLVLAHLSTPLQVAQYSLMAQIYAMCWMVLATTGFASWPIFVRRRGATAETLRIWTRLTATLVVVAIVEASAMIVLGPWATRLLSGGQINGDRGLALAFGALLVAQAAYFSTQMLLTGPKEARWLAVSAVAMAVVSVGGALVVASTTGAEGVVYTAAAGVIAAQAIPGFIWVPKLIRRRVNDGDQAE